MIYGTKVTDMLGRWSRKDRTVTSKKCIVRCVNNFVLKSVSAGGFRI